MELRGGGRIRNVFCVLKGISSFYSEGVSICFVFGFIV